ncbi:serine hydrolase, partial [uncultured Muribaculum sp.]
VPASMSHRIITDLLKKDMGFRGMVFTDALAMKGAIVGENNCVAALMAGADVLLSPSSVKGDIAAVLAAVKSGKISENSINERCRKMLEYKYALGLSTGHKAVSSASLKGKLNSPEADAVNRKLVSAMITCVSNDNDLLPVRDIDRKSIAVVNIGEGKGNTFTRYCGKYADVDAYGTIGAFTATQIASIEKHDIVIAAVYNDKSTSVNALKQLKGCSGLVTVFFMNPYKMSKFAPLDSKALLLVGENGELAQEYGAQAVFGGIRVNGSLPVNVKGIAPLGACVGLVKTRLGYTSPTAIGFDSSLDKRVDSLVNVGLRTGAFPGCQVLVAKDGNVVIDRSYGYVDAAKTRRVNDSTMYDIASVSKVAGTLPGLMLAYDEGLYKLDDPVSKYVEGLKSGDKSDITIRQMLLHESGLPASLSIPGIVMDTATYKGRLIAYRQRGANTIKISRGVYGNNTARMRKDITSASESKDFPMKIGQGVYVGAATRDTLMQRIFDSKLRQSKNYLYSDLNFALLMAMEEKLTGEKHDEFVEKRVYGPIGATRTCYVPLAKNHKASEIAPTEKDNFLRRQTVHGYVHDELAAFSGGVQGNAGLFSTANDLGKLCQMWLNDGNYGGRQIMSPSTVKMFTTTKSKKSRRWLGFDGPDTENEAKTPTAPDASASTYGHIGFTGTCFWVDPDNGLIYVFLCNRVNPSRDNSAFTRLNIRPAIMSAVYDAMK